MKTKSFLFLVIITLIPGGCTLAPEYTRPASPVPGDWPTGPAFQAPETVAAAPTGAELKWQEFFTDERLQKIIETALRNNRDLRLAALNVERARAIYGIQRAELLPTINAVGSGSKERVPADLSRTGREMTSERYDVDLGIMSWEIDFFGRIRSMKDRALEEYLATDQARRSAQILLVSAVADAYFTLGADRENLKLAASTLEAQEASYKLIRKRFDVGLASELDLRQAQSLVDVAMRDVARYTQIVAQDKNALNLLVGSPLPPELLPSELGNVSPPREISPGLSSEV
ncbi:MAG: TolC family protein, partial [Deltaproteobacteria bacterium]|nr:TolC family protein [Deltaproteobacteria bacterium]